MTFRLALVTASLTLLWPSSVLAQSGANATSVDSIPLEKLCGVDGAPDLRFGERAESLTKASYKNVVTRKLDGSLAPFAEAELGYTRYTNRLWNIAYQSGFVSADEAMAAADLLAAKAQAQNWHSVSEPSNDDIQYQYSFSTTADPADPPANDEVTLTITVEENTVVINCQNDALSVAHLDEAVGKMPVGTPRPQLADYDVPQSSFTAADCDDQAKREEFQKEMEEGRRSAFSPNWSRTAYEEDLANWKIMKLTSSGKTDFETVSDQIIALLDSPDSKAAMEDSLTMLEELGTDMDQLDPQDEAGMCRVMFKMMAKSAARFAPKPGVTGDAITPQWHATHELLDEEARRLGVSFDS